MATLQTFDDNYFTVEETATQAVSENAEDIDKLKRLKSVSQSFLRVNDFDVDEPDIRDLSTEQFIDYIEATNKENTLLVKFDELNIENDFRSSMSRVYHKKENEEDKILIFFLPNDKKSSNTIGISHVKIFIALLFKMNCMEGVLISEKPLSSTSQKHVKFCNINPENSSRIYNIITYQDDEFIDIPDHSFIPEVLEIYRAGEEVKKFSDENSINPNKLPRMITDDPLVKFYRGNLGDVFKIKRKILNSNTLLEHQIVFKIITITKAKVS
jgi:DNA-directed RNA polymerase subunit H (RpoH/RPB5)